MRLFGRLLVFLTHTGWRAFAAFALSGSDLLSTTDIEYHFRKLRLGTYPLLLDTRAKGPAPAPRTRLDSRAISAHGFAVAGGRLQGRFDG